MLILLLSQYLLEQTHNSFDSINVPTVYVTVWLIIGLVTVFSSTLKLYNINEYSFKVDENTVTNPMINRNEAKYINHSCVPNCDVHRWNVDGIERVGVFALTDIAKGEELTYNYKWTSTNGEGRICYCGNVENEH